MKYAKSGKKQFLARDAPQDYKLESELLIEPQRRQSFLRQKAQL